MFHDKGVGDAVAQAIPPLFYGNNDDNEEKIKPMYDYERTARAIIFGSVIHAPSAHVHYNFLESLTLKAGITGLKIPVFKAVMEQVRLTFF